MGHKINPTIYRLGTSVDCKYQLRDPLLANIYIYKMVKNIALQYTAPYIPFPGKKTYKPASKGLKKTIKRVIKNPFIKNSFLFSHLNISCTSSLYLAIFFLDSAAENERKNNNRLDTSFYYLSGKFFRKSPRFYSYFRKNIFLTYDAAKKQEAFPFFFYTEQLSFCVSNDNNDNLNNTLVHHYKKNKKRKVRLRLRLAPWYKRKYRRRYSAPSPSASIIPSIYPGWLTNFNEYAAHNHRSRHIRKNLRILRFLIRYLKVSNKTFSKKRLFFFNTLIGTLLTLLLLLPINAFSKRIFIFMSLCYMYLMSFKYLHLNYNKAIYQSRLYLFQSFSKILTFTLKKITFFPTRETCLRFYGLHNRNLNANFLLNYFLFKLGQYFILNQILQPIVNQLETLPFIQGYRLIFTGRLTRKERAAYIIKRYQSMPLAHLSTYVDYASDFKIMKFGVVGIKIYLQYNETPPYYYFFEFRTQL